MNKKAKVINSIECIHITRLFQHVLVLSFSEIVDYILCIIAFLENFNFVCIKTKTDLLTFSFVE